MPGPYREVKRVRCRAEARGGGGVKTPPYKERIQWRQPWGGGPGMPGPYREVKRVSCRVGAMAARRQSGSSYNKTLTKKGRCIATASFLLYSNLRMAKITWTSLRPGGPAGPRHPACTARRGRGHTCRSRGGSCRGLPPTAGGHGRGGCSRQSRSRGRRAGSQ